MTGEKTDVAHWLISASQKSNTLEQDRDWLNGDAVTIVIAGRWEYRVPFKTSFIWLMVSSDTVAPSLVFTFYELALNCEQQEKLYRELSAIDVYDRKLLRSLPHLNGVINESLRIHPPVPTGGYRQSPLDGMKIGSQYIPGGVTIVAPRYTLGKRWSSSYLLGNRILTKSQLNAASTRPDNSFQNAGIASQR